MNDMTTIARPSAKVAEEVARCRAEYSQRNPVSQGAVALAALIQGGEHSEDALGALATALGGWRQIERMISDDITPGHEFGEILGRMTGGELTAAAWNRPYAGEIGSPVDIGDHSATTDVARCGPQPFPYVGVLGTVPSGPLFRFGDVPGEPNVRWVGGLGILTGLSEEALAALRDTCAAALADIRASAVA